MKTWKVLSLAGLVLSSICVWCGPVQAQYYGRDLDQREEVQQQRIQQGIQSGAITPQEARRLGMEQRHIQAAEERMRADGRLAPRERARLNQMLNKADRDISREKHDNQMAYSGKGNHRDPRFQQWQHNQRRDHRQGNHNFRRENGCDRGASYRPNLEDRSRFSRLQHREHRTAWNR
jgi:hypothetical protein